MLAESFRPNDGFKRVKDVLFIFWLVGVVVLFFALLTHDAADNNFLNDSAAAVGNIKNVIGVVGARLSDGLFSYFGICAFLIPVLLLYMGYFLLWNNVRWYDIQYGTIGVRIIGLNFLLISSCCLVSEANISSVNNKGGHLGYVISDILSQYVGFTGSVLTMLAFLLAGVVLFTGWSLSSICEAVGTVVMAPFTHDYGILRIFSKIFQNKPVAGQSVEEPEEEEVKPESSKYSIIEVENAKTTVKATENTEALEQANAESSFVDFTKPNINLANNESSLKADDNLVIPGLNSFDPEQRKEPEVAPTPKSVEERVEPTLNIDEVLESEVEDKNEPYLASTASASQKAEEPTEEVEIKHVRTLVLPSPNQQREEQKLKNEQMEIHIPDSYQAQPSLTPKEEAPAVAVSPLTKEAVELAEPANAVIAEDDKVIDTTNVINFKDIRTQNEDSEAELGLLPTGFTPVAEGINKELNHKEAQSPFAAAFKPTQQATPASEPIKVAAPVKENAISAVEPPAMNNSFKYIDVDSDLPDGIRFNTSRIELPADDNGKFPSLSIFSKAKVEQLTASEADIYEVIEKINACFKHYNIQAHVATEEKVNPINGQSELRYLYQSGPVITRYMIKLEKGLGNKIVNMSKDLARYLCAPSIHIIEVIPGQPYFGIEIPNAKRGFINMRSLLESSEFRDSKADLAMAIGKDIVGKPVILDLARAPHLLVAGTTGSGKSVGIGTMLVSLLMKNTPKELRLILIDPKMLEFSMYHDIPHLLTPIITDVKKSPSALRWAVNEMERRYTIMSKLGVRNISGYNELIENYKRNNTLIKDPTWRPSDSMDMEAPNLDKFPFIVIAVDEFADLILQLKKNGDVEGLLARLAAKARAAGIHIILATQSPRADVITGVIRTNFPSQIAFKVKSGNDSRIVIDEGGAEDLLGYGDMLIKFNDGTNFIRRAHGAYIKDEELETFTESWRSRGRPEYVDSVITTELNEDNALPGEIVPNNDEKDNLYDQAVEFCCELKSKNKKFSVSQLQRQFSIGYNRAARIADALEKNGIVSEPMGGNGNREILIGD